MIHARMRLHAGSECLLSDLFRRACGSNKAMTAKMQIASKIVFGDEAAQFYVLNRSKNGFEHSGDEGMVLQCGTDFQRPFGNSEQSVITKTHTNSLGIDMRVFARHGGTLLRHDGADFVSFADSEIEIWAQAKGRTSPLGWSQVIECIKVCFQECFNLEPGVKKFCVVFSLHGFTFEKVDLYTLFKEEGIRMGDTAKFSKMYEHTLLVDQTGLNVFMPDVMQRHYNY
ncbi:uncharacterized protein LOC9650691 [Selaginella moellendorffii]|uniref:uncharacterized protein LOC9650691 n=1 Tax=Selaginella moellendorffii TaxID=88036 RepID=UPI000D1CC900|nr:uncharacterized protein LOC9650691 [Selaginella moellendorffii]|eukprot:XP_024521636.1 uncharacterized protein LOC9650691 [Selaginella moellendorffii]